MKHTYLIKNLKHQLTKFYDTSENYFISASESNKIPSEERKRILDWISYNDKVLDVACGTAENAELIIQKAIYYGIDIPDIALRIAQQKYSSFKKVFFTKGDAENLPYPDNFFDVVLSTYSLEHFTSPKKVIDEMIRVCKLNGKIILISPAWDNPLWVPPSLSKKLNNFFRRIIFILQQIIKLFLLSFKLKKYFFDIVKNPAILEDNYQMDNDAVYIVRVVEIINYFQEKNCEILYIRKNATDAFKLKFPFLKNLKHNCLTFFAYVLNIFYKHLNTGLFIVVEKKIR
ncbi:MAG: methyltransferase domain-containing protein [Elusimicrobiota bacterium]|nr:methyltransferase domain-containing protein [Endomicrobiia bacterium]MDW8166475.1 methyltransferase domain-containing protein [Elusimicrobiota bacterium]